MVGCLGRSRPAQDADVVARAVAAVALAALAVIHVVDLPGTLGAIPLVGIGYFGIIVVAALAGMAMIIRAHWLAWAASGRQSRTTLRGPMGGSTPRFVRTGSIGAVRMRKEE
jgi:hypothetical protein